MESQQQSVGTDNQQPQDIPSGMTTLAELLDQGEQSVGADTAAESGGSHEKTQPKQFNDLAESLGMELDDLYKLEVKSSEDGEPVTIEQLKDLHKERSDFQLNQLEWEENRTAAEQQLMREKAELQEILQALPEKAIKPEVLERLRNRSEQQVKVERQKTLEVIPDWNDAKVREADIAGMTEHLQQYGFPVNYLEQIVSHQQLKYIRDNWQREQRKRKALEAVRTGKPGKATSSKTQGKPPVKNPVQSIKRGSARNQLEAVFSTID